jgi:hypothetical protein
MSPRGWSNSRRRDVSSHRRLSQLFGQRRTSPSHAATNTAPSPSASVTEALRVPARPTHRPVEAKTVIRLDGDSIAYFWALETETAISYETLTLHWREFIDALTNAWHWG